MFTKFGEIEQFAQTSTTQFILHVLPDQPCPLINLDGFHIRLIKWCTMRVNNLGIYQVVTAEGLLAAAEAHGQNGFRDTYNAFRRWCTAKRISCSVRAWKLKHFHLGPDPMNPTQHPWVNFKAYNCRVVLGWLSDTRLQRSKPALQIPLPD